MSSIVLSLICQLVNHWLTFILGINGKQLQLYIDALWTILLFHYQVLPSFVDKRDALLLRELTLMWSNYKMMTKWLCKFFESIDRHFVPNSCYCSLNDISNNNFHDLVKKFVIFFVLTVFYFVTNISPPPPCMFLLNFVYVGIYWFVSKLTGFQGVLCQIPGCCNIIGM